MIVLPYLISTVLGLLVLYAILKDEISFPFLLALGVGIGLGISALITFLTFLIFNQYTPAAVIIFNLLAIATLGFLTRSTVRNQLRTFSGGKIFALIRPRLIFASLLWIILGVYTIFIAKLHPYGEWDAWALWNTKLKFLTLGGAHWRDIFSKLHWHTQPDYPLLLPMINVWGGTFTAPYPFTNVAFLTSVIFTFLTVFLLYTALSHFIDKKAAFWASTLCLANPYFIYKATSQYADTVFCYYLLCCLLMFMMTLQLKKNNFCFLTGISLGLLTFTKNEGIAIALILSVLLSCFVLFNKELTTSSKKHLILNFLKGLLITGAAAIIFKIFLAPPNRDILTNLNGPGLPYLNGKGISTVADFVLKEMVDKRWVNLWILLTLLAVIGAPKLFAPTVRPLTLFFLCYFIVLVAIYLTTSTMDLSWRLKSTIPRIFFYLMPSLIFLCFLIHFKNADTSTVPKELKRKK